MNRFRKVLLLAVVLWPGSAGMWPGGETAVAAAEPQSPALQVPRNRMTHDNDVSSVSYSPDGKTLASGSHDQTIKLWDTATGKELATFRGHTESVFSVAFSPDGKTLASGSLDKLIKLWEVATGKEQATLKGHTDWVQSVAYSPDGKTLASGSWDHTIKLWDVATGKEIPTATPNVVVDAATLAKARVDAAHKAYDVAVTLVQQGSPGAKLEDVCTWSVRWLNAQHDMSSKQEDQLSALNAHLQRMQQHAKVARAFWQAGGGSLLDSVTADYYLTEAEFWLAQATAAAKKADK